MEISIKAKERFCKDCNIPLRLFQEPYFTDRINLYDKFYGTFEKWELFKNELSKYNYEQDYFEEYNSIKDDAILFIKNSEGYKRFNEEDMNKFRVKNTNLPSNDIFKSSNDGKYFLSIDMRKANFSSLSHYCSDIFGVNTWEEFVGKFTNNKHIVNSKYIRQVILGNCNPKRHITYEKYIMDGILEFITKFFIPIDKVAFFSNDEIVFDVTDKENKEHLMELQQILDEKCTVPFKVELFKLHKIIGTEGYYKKIYNQSEEESIEFKCLDNYMLPFVIRKFTGEEATENDKVFYHEGLLSKFIEVPNISIDGMW
jgi:hypothetical protein